MAGSEGSFAGKIKIHKIYDYAAVRLAGAAGSRELIFILYESEIIFTLLLAPIHRVHELDVRISDVGSLSHDVPLTWHQGINNLRPSFYRSLVAVVHDALVVIGYTIRIILILGSFN